MAAGSIICMTVEISGLVKGERMDHIKSMIVSISADDELRMSTDELVLERGRPRFSVAHRLLTVSRSTTHTFSIIVPTVSAVSDS